MKTKNSLALFSLFLFFAGCMSLQTGGEVQWGRQALLEGKNEAALGYFTVPLRGTPIMCMRPGALRSRAFGVMLDDQSTLPAEFPKPGKPWNGRLPPIRRRYRQALSGSDLGPRRRSPARLKGNRRRDARH